MFLQRSALGTQGLIRDMDHISVTMLSHSNLSTKPHLGWAGLAFSHQHWHLSFLELKTLRFSYVFYRSTKLGLTPNLGYYSIALAEIFK